MIPCPNCTFVNPLGTRFCRSCGERLEVKLSQVAESVSKTKQTDRETAILKTGISALTMGGFFFIAALILRSTLVPDVPAPDLPPVAVTSLLPDSFTKPGDRPVDTTSDSPRLTWRHNLGATMLADLGVDHGRLEDWLGTVLKAQKEDGGYAGGDPLVATALATLALQACPDADQLAAAGKARAWLKAKAKALSGNTALARTLTLTALIDAEDLPPELWKTNQSYLSDGQAPGWQALGVALLPPASRHVDHSLLRNTSQDPLWVAWWDAVEGKPANASDTAFATVDTANLATGEDRLQWTQETWFLAGPPDDLQKALEAWSRADPVPVSPDLLAQAGPWAPAAVAVLTVASPVRMLPLALSSP